MEPGKVCSKCGEWKSYGEYHKKNSNKDGYNGRCISCIKEIAKQYRQENKEKIRENHKKIYQMNKEKISVRNKKQREENREEINKRQRKNYQKNKEKVSVRHKKYRKENKEKLRNWFKNFYKENKKELLEKCRNYSQTKKGKETLYRKNLKRRTHKYNGYISPHKRIDILDRDNWTCQSCGKWVHDVGTKRLPRNSWDNEHKAHIDHIIPLSKGGNSEISNLQVLCRICNRKKHNRLPEENEITLFNF